MRNKKRLAACILKTSPGKVRFEAGALEDIKKAITRADIRGLIANSQITESKRPWHSRGRARKQAVQKKKSRRKGQGSREGRKSARFPQKKEWIRRIRKQRAFLKRLREKKAISPESYHQVYQKIKGGYFRNKRHLKLYLEENKLIKKA